MEGFISSDCDARLSITIETSPNVSLGDEESHGARLYRKITKHQHQRNRHLDDDEDASNLTIKNINSMIEQIRRCESILTDGLAVNGSKEQLSDRLLAKVNRLTSLQLRCRRPMSLTTLDRNNNKCCNGAAASANAVDTDAAQFDTTAHGENTESEAEDAAAAEEGDNSGRQAYPKHQDYCLCHKRKCVRCGCLCPCSEHACPSCGYTSRVVMTMRAVDGLKQIANAQRCRHRNGRMAKVPKCKSNRKRFLLNEGGNECTHAVMVRVGGGFVPLVEYLKSHNKVVLSKFTREDGSAFLSPWRPYYAGPLKKGRPRGIRYVDTVTQQLEEIIFANREAGKSQCTCP